MVRRWFARFEAWRRDRALRLLLGPEMRGVHVCNHRHRMILLPRRRAERGKPVECPLCGAVSALVSLQLEFSEIALGADHDAPMAPAYYLRRAERGFNIAAETVAFCNSSNANR